MTTDQRSHISNAIWLCATHAKLIDRDESTYSATTLREMKSAHETAIAAEVRGSDSAQLDLIAVGSDLIALASMTGGGGSSVEFTIHHFVIGDLEGLLRFGEEFSTLATESRYLLSNELADGRSLDSPPTWRRTLEGIVVLLERQPRHPRIRAQELGTDFKIGPDHDLTPDLASVSGIEAFPQKVANCLSTRRGEWFLDETFGTRLAEYCTLFSGSPWLDQILKLEVIRMASIPHTDALRRTQRLPLECVDSVELFELCGTPKLGEWNEARVRFQVNGLGTWEKVVEVFLPFERAN